MNLMNKIKLILLFAFIFFLAKLNAQDFSVRFQSGYGFYNMKSMEGLQNGLLNSIFRVQLKTVQSFPPFVNFEFQFAKSFSSNINGGLFFQFLSTGGRDAVSDYSGEINIDQIINGYNGGLLFEAYILKKEIKHLLFTFQLSYMYSTLQLKQSIKIYDQSNSQSTKFSSIGFGVEPGFAYEIPIKPIIIRANLSFNAGLFEDFHLTNNSDLTMNNKPDWTGLRLGLTVGYEF